MKPTTLTQAVLTSLTAITLTACGGGDDGGAIYGVQDNSTPIVPTITPTVTPNPAPVAPDFVALAKQAGLNDANAELFAQNAKHLAVDSADFQDALVQAIKAQQADNAIKQNTVIDPIAKPVDTANPFINGVDVSKQPTMGSSHYVRQMGSNYERTANPEAMAGLGAVATDDPTKSNPWLSNYVLGVEAIRDGDGSVKVVAIDSTGEMAVAVTDPLARGVTPINPNNPNEGIKVGKTDEYRPGGVSSMSPIPPMFTIVRGNVDSKSSPYYTKNGFVYKTQRRSGDIGEYDYTTNNDPNGNAITLQRQNMQHRSAATQKVVEDSLYIAKNQTPFNETPSSYTIEEFTYRGGRYGLFNHSASSVSSLPNGDYPDYPYNTNGARELFGQHFSVDLIVYNTKSKPVGHSTGKALGYKVPIYGKEENIYQRNEQTDELEVINGVDIKELSSSPNINVQWYGSRYGTWEAITKKGVSKFVIKDNGELITDGSRVINNSTSTNKFYGRKVANNDQVRIYGKNFIALEAGAEGKQISNNTYTGKYKVDGTLGKIAPDKLHNVQYGRLTNNIDILALSEFDNHTGQPRIIHRQFQPHGAPNTVDTYFYRGTNHTTMDEMASIKARGGTYRYHGHALTYNLGPYVNTAPVSTGGIPTAYGSSVAMSSGTTIGNFVEATFDAGKGKVTGSIYNFLNKEHSNKDEDFKKQDLATFEGDVFGNTVVGTSAKVGTNEVGSFTGSFFGQGASELGGNISSISREQGYGDAKWGAVFGATRGTVVDNYNVVEQ